MIYRKPYTMPIPPDAQIIEHDGKVIAHWRLRNGQRRSGEVVDCIDGKIRIRGQSRNYMARYRNECGEIVEVATGCKDAVAARAVLTQLERRVEMIRAGVLTVEQANAANHANVSLSKHIDAYARHLQVKDGNPRRISMLRRRLERLVHDCRFPTLSKMQAGPLEKWLVDQAGAGLSASTRNTYREAAVCFGNWCKRTHRMTYNPFANVPRADQNVNRKHQRRALTEVELLRLLKVTRLRALAEFGREVISLKSDPDQSSTKRANWKYEPLCVNHIDAAVVRARKALKDKPDLIDQLERTGYERMLIYKTLVLTGLRKGELASLTVGQLEFDGQVAYAVLYAADEKNRKGSNIPIRGDLAVELTAWLYERLAKLQVVAGRNGKPIPARLPPTTPLFNMPSGLTRIFDRDLAAAGISKRDERNRVLDIHALRVTFGTHLCAAGVPLRTAQAAMRHSKPELTANIYTDPKLLDIAGAINALPSLVTEPTVAKTSQA